MVIHHTNEPASNAQRDLIAIVEPKSLRTYTPTQLVIDHAAGVFLWTAEGRRLYDFTSGVLVANLGHNPKNWLDRVQRYLGWPATADRVDASGFVSGPPLTAYNAITPLESEATHRLIRFLQPRPGGGRLQQVMWAASGSEAIQKALWAALARDRTRDMILATRFGFHGKKGLAGATTGSETDRDRDPRVRFVSFPREDYQDVSLRSRPFDPAPYRLELEALKLQFGRRLTALITEPYLGGGGSYHPPKEYLQLLQQFCRDNDILFILDEVQANFGRTGAMFAFESYGLEPDFVVLGKGLANGAPGAAAVGRKDVFDTLDYGEGSDTYSGNPFVCAAVLATLDTYESADILGPMRQSSRIIEAGLVRLKELPFISAIRGEKEGMVWGVEFADYRGKAANELANAAVLALYRAAPQEGIHLLGPLARKIVRVAPPLIITAEQSQKAMELMHGALNTIR